MQFAIFLGHASHPHQIQNVGFSSLPPTHTRYNIHIELGGVAAVVAPVIGNQPSDLK